MEIDGRAPDTRTVPTAAPARVRERLAALASAGLDAPAFGLTALDLLRSALPFSAACLATVDPATEIVTGVVKADLTDENDDLWAHHEYEVVDLYNSFDVFRRPGGVTTALAETGGDLSRLRRFDEFFSPVYGFGDELRFTAATDDARWGFVALFRDDRRGFSPAEQEYATDVGRLFGRGMRAGLVAGAVADGPGVADGPAVLVVGRDGAVTHGGPGVGERLTDLGGDAGGALPFPLVGLIRAARRYAAGHLPQPPRTRLRTRSGHWVVAHASPLAGPDGTGGQVVVTIEEARPPEIVPLVTAAFGLTPRERDVVGLVLRGADTAEIARTLHLSAWTVQDHLKSVFARVGVRSRRELTARVYFDQYAPRLQIGAGLTPSGWFAGTA